MNSGAPGPNKISESTGANGAHSAESLFPDIYQQLRALAASRLNSLLPGQTLQPTAVVHEAWLRLGVASEQRWESRTHFFATAAEVMRYVVVDHIRAKARLKRGGGQLPSNIDDLELASREPDEKVLLINDALEALQREHPDKARIVTLKFFGGLTDREVAESLGVTERTIERHWAYAKAWLFEHINKESTGSCRD